MSKGVLPSLQGSCAFPITPSDTLDIKFDPANPTLGSTSPVNGIYIHCAGASGLCTVTPVANPVVSPAVEPDPVEVYLTQGQTLPLAVRRVWSTGKAAGDLVAFYGLQNI